MVRLEEVTQFKIDPDVLRVSTTLENWTVSTGRVQAVDATHLSFSMWEVACGSWSTVVEVSPVGAESTVA